MVGERGELPREDDARGSRMGGAYGWPAVRVESFRLPLNPWQCEWVFRQREIREMALFVAGRISLSLLPNLFSRWISLSLSPYLSLVGFQLCQELPTGRGLVAEVMWLESRPSSDREEDLEVHSAAEEDF